MNTKDYDIVDKSEYEAFFKQLGIKPGFIKGTDIVKIFKNKSSAIEEISQEKFQKTLDEKNLVVANFNGYVRIIKNPNI